MCALTSHSFSEDVIANGKTDDHVNNYTQQDLKSKIILTCAAMIKGNIRAYLIDSKVYFTVAHN